jgi:hypothetical protein
MENSQPRISMEQEKVFILSHLVVSGWEQHTVSSIKQPEKNYIAMNKEGAKQGCTDAKVTYLFN